ncbi:hypothetical protein F4778DRAFT_1911 [Xylariomycetidae sp. FL2044]|nr:hypothetical protein F4778DRAFT_1911 [Xylariomycetidae sp. FL2044]
MATPAVAPSVNLNTKPQLSKLSITPTSTVSSPASAASPASNVSTPTAIHHLAMKPAEPGSNMTTTGMTLLPPKSSITSKEWVVPPRPKPGRKPATDTPPTKRKAQNRAAQRAFRERRAARVGELEEQLDDQKAEYDRVEQELRDRVQGLDSEVQSLRNQCALLEGTLEKERAERVRMANELDSLRRRWRIEEASLSSRNGSFTTHQGNASSSYGIMSGQQTPRTSVASNTSGHRNSTNFSISQIISPVHPNDPPGLPEQSSAALSGCGNCVSNGPCTCVDEVLASAAVGCGRCSIGTKCECLETALKGVSSNAEPELKRRPSSISAIAPDGKRQKSDEYPEEIDFTNMFSKQKPTTVPATAPEPTPYQPAPIQQAIPPRDSCGFCTEGTYCMCAEAAAAAAHTLPPMSQQVQTPPPSDGDVGTAPMEIMSPGVVKLPGISSLNRAPAQVPRPAGGCGPNGPGTCTQCLGDAKSGLFCRSLAANFARDSGKAPEGCCGGSASGGCCKSTSASDATGPNSSVNPTLGISLSCADTYKTLASHRNFEKAADNIGTWLPKLRAAPRQAHRLPIEVEAASIMGVLKEFDVRFGREA